MRQPFCMSSSISTFSPTLPLHSTALYFRAFQNFVFFSFFFFPSRLDSHAMQADATDAKQQQKLSFIPFFPFRYFKKIIFPRFNVFRRLYRAPTAFVFVSHTRKATSKESLERKDWKMNFASRMEFLMGSIINPRQIPSQLPCCSYLIDLIFP